MSLELFLELWASQNPCVRLHEGIFLAFNSLVSCCEMKMKVEMGIQKKKIFILTLKLDIFSNARNTWNAVYAAGGWRLIQCNWAMLNLHSRAERETRKFYQDHYFLTDPDKFIFEFFPRRVGVV